MDPCITPNNLLLKHLKCYFSKIYVYIYIHTHSFISDSLNPMDCSLAGSFVHVVFQARILERVAIPFSMESS